MAQEELDLLKFAAAQVTETGARAAEVVRCQLLDARIRSRDPHDIPKDFRRHPIAPDSAGLIDRAEDSPRGDTAGGRPRINRGLDPLRNRHRRLRSIRADNGHARRLTRDRRPDSIG